MIDLDEIERRITHFGSGVHGDIAIELITRLREAEKDAARYRWIKVNVDNDDADSVLERPISEWDYAIDEARQCK